MYSVSMQVFVRLLRRRSVRIAPGDARALQWTEAVLCSVDAGAERCIGANGLLSIPGAPPMATLYAPVIVRVEGDSLVLRGIERVTGDGGQQAAVVQEWMVKHRPSLGPAGLQAADTRGRRPDIAP